MTNFLTIDISEHNGWIDFEKLKNESEVSMIMIRAGYGWSFHEDKYFKRNKSECERLGIPYGVYLYTYSTNMDQAIQEVNEFIQFLKDNDVKAHLPIVIDTEDSESYRKNNGNPSWSLLADMCIEQCDRLEKAGYYAMYYASKYWVNSMRATTSGLDRFDLWLADWGISEPSMKCSIWQYTDAGKVAGIKTNVDMNLTYVDYPTVIYNAGLNHLNGYVIEDIATPPTHPGKKSLEQLVEDVLNGEYGNGQERINKLQAEGYNYDIVQDEVNKKVYGDFTVGDTVRIVGSHYATGEKIPDWCYGIPHVILQDNGDKILLKEIYSWVYRNDLRRF